MKSFTSDSLTLNYLEWGTANENGTVVLLHGFPQSAESWATVANLLAAEGLHVIALMQRGYSEGARPSSIKKYGLESLSLDVENLIKELNLGAVHLVGHDWGGAVSWVFAAKNHLMVKSLTVFSMPHPGTLGKTLISSFQVVKSWYVIFFMLPVLPEVLIRGKDRRVGYQLLESTGLDRDIAMEYVNRLCDDPGALSAALNWYRAAPLNLGYTRNLESIQSRTLFVWGDGDVAVDRRAVDLTSEHVKSAYRLVVLKDTSHWIPEQSPHKAAQLVIENVTAT